MEKLWEFSGETKQFGVITLKRIKLSKDCKWGESGKLGGWIEKESNLSESSWVYGDAQVYGNARVFGDAWVCGNAQVYGNARVCGDAWEKSPLQIQGTKHFVNLATKTKVQIGCKCFHIDVWLIMFRSIGPAEGYTKKQVEEYGLYLELIKKIIESEQ